MDAPRLGTQHGATTTALCRTRSRAGIPGSGVIDLVSGGHLHEHWAPHDAEALAEFVQRRPDRELARALSGQSHRCMGSGNGAEVAHWTARALAHLDDGSRDDADAIRVAAGAIEACGAARDGVVAMRTHAVEAFNLMPAEDPWRSSCRLVEGASRHLTGDPALARVALEDAARRGIVVAPGINTVALAQLALLALDEDDLIEAGDSARSRSSGPASTRWPTTRLRPWCRPLPDSSRPSVGIPPPQAADITRAVSLLSRLTDFSPWYGPRRES